jgi:hypothetical protein
MYITFVSTSFQKPTHEHAIIENTIVKPKFNLQFCDIKTLQHFFLWEVTYELNLINHSTWQTNYCKHDSASVLQI